MTKLVSGSHWWKRQDTFFCLAWAVLALAFFSGFLFRDQSFLNAELHPRLFLYIGLLSVYGISFAIFGLVLGTYLGTRSGVLSSRLAWFLPIIAVGLGILIYVPLSIAYESALGPKKKFHPYLQNYPPDLVVLEKTGSTKILCLGGSTTEWAGPKGERWTERIEELLPGQVETINQSRAFYTSQHSLINYQLNLRELDVDYVVVLHAINDFMHNADHSYYSNGEFRQDYGHLYGPLARLGNQRPLVTLVWNAFQRGWYWRGRQPLDEYEFPGLVPFERNLNRLVELIRADGAIPVLMTQGSLYRDDLTEMEISNIWMHTHNGVGPEYYWTLETPLRGMQAYNETIRRVATETNVDLIDLDQVLPKDLEHFLDDCHYNDAGMEKISNAVADYFRGQLDGTK